MQDFLDLMHSLVLILVFLVRRRSHRLPSQAVVAGGRIGEEEILNEAVAAIDFWSFGAHGRIFLETGFVV